MHGGAVVGAGVCPSRRRPAPPNRSIQNLVLFKVPENMVEHVLCSFLTTSNKIYVSPENYVILGTVSRYVLLLKHTISISPQSRSAQKSQKSEIVVISHSNSYIQKLPGNTKILNQEL